MSGKPSPSKSATQTPGPNISRLIGIPSLPRKWTTLIPEGPVTFVNCIEADREACACVFVVQFRPAAMTNGMQAEIKNAALSQERRRAAFIVRSGIALLTRSCRNGRLPCWTRCSLRFSARYRDCRFANSAAPAFQLLVRRVASAPLPRLAAFPVQSCRRFPSEGPPPAWRLLSVRRGCTQAQADSARLGFRAEASHRPPSEESLQQISLQKHTSCRPRAPPR